MRKAVKLVSWTKFIRHVTECSVFLAKHWFMVYSESFHRDSPAASKLSSWCMMSCEGCHSPTMSCMDKNDNQNGNFNCDHESPLNADEWLGLDRIEGVCQAAFGETFQRVNFPKEVPGVTFTKSSYSGVTTSRVWRNGSSVDPTAYPNTAVSARQPANTAWNR